LQSLEYLAVPGDLEECKLLSNMTWLKALVLISRVAPKVKHQIASLSSALAQHRVISVSHKQAEALSLQVPFFTSIWTKTVQIDGNMTLSQYYGATFDTNPPPPKVMSILHQLVQFTDPDIFDEIIPIMSKFRSAYLNTVLPSDFLVSEPVLHRTPLSWAISCEYHDIALRLISMGADPNYQNPDGTTVVHDLLANGSAEVIAALEQRGVVLPAIESFPLHHYKVRIGYVIHLKNSFGATELCNRFRTSRGEGVLRLLLESLPPPWHRNDAVVWPTFDSILKACPTQILLDDHTGRLPHKLFDKTEFPENFPLQKFAEMILAHHGEDCLIAILSRKSRKTGLSLLVRSWRQHSQGVTRSASEFPPSGTFWSPGGLAVTANALNLFQGRPRALAKILNSECDREGRTLLFDLVLALADASIVLPIADVPRAPKTDYSFDPSTSYGNIFDSAINTSFFDWSKYSLSVAAALLACSCRIGATNIIANLLPLVSKEQRGTIAVFDSNSKFQLNLFAVDTILPFTCLPAAIQVGSAIIVGQLIQAGVKSIPLAHLPEADRQGKKCCLATLRSVCATNAQRQKLNEQALVEIARMIVLNLPASYNARDDPDLNQLSGVIKEAANIAIAERRSSAFSRK
jgi:hypothetical protein